MYVNVINATITAYCTVFHFEFLRLPGLQIYLTYAPISLLSSAGNWYQDVQAVLVLGMIANKSIAQ